MKTRLITAAILVLATLPAFSIPPVPSTDMLLKDLSTANDTAQARARQLLPRKGAEAIPGLVALLGNDQDFVWRAVFQVLRDIAHEAPVITMDGAPGASPKGAVRDALMPLLADGQPEQATIRALQLLPFVVDEGVDVTPIVALLDNAAMRDKARSALEEIGTVEALRALAQAAGEEKDPAFQYALLTSLSSTTEKLGDLSIAETLSASADPMVRAAAARLLAERGAAKDWPAILLVAQTSDAVSSFEAWDACLRYADTLARKGGRWEQAMAAYKEVLAKGPDTVIKSGALAGLGRFGDDSAIPVILEAVNGPGGDQLAAPALLSLGGLSGRAADETLVKAWPVLCEDLKAGLLENLGARRSALCFALLKEQAASSDAALKMAALKGLSLSGLPEAAPILSGALAQANEETKPLLEKMVKNFADDSRDQNTKESGRSAGIAYVALYRSAADPDLKAAGFDGIRQFPVPEAFDIVMEMLKSGSLTGLSAGSMVGIAKSAIDAGQVEEGTKILNEVMGRLTTPESVREVIAILGTMGVDSSFAKRLGVIQEWLVLGPFAWNQKDGLDKAFIGEPNLSFTGRFPGISGEVAWKKLASGDLAGNTNLAAAWGMVDSAIGFAYVDIEVAADTDASLRGGSDDGLKIWVNGQEVHKNDVDRPQRVDDDIVPIKLKAGKNPVLVLISQRLGGWGFCMRLTKSDGTALDFKTSLPETN